MQPFQVVSDPGRDSEQPHGPDDFLAVVVVDVGEDGLLHLFGQVLGEEVVLVGGEVDFRYELVVEVDKHAGVVLFLDAAVLETRGDRFALDQFVVSLTDHQHLLMTGKIRTQRQNLLLVLPPHLRIRQPDPLHKLLRELPTEQRRPHVRVQDGDQLLVGKEFQVEDYALLKVLQDLDSLVLVLFGVVGVVDGHYYEARGGD